MLFPFWFQCGSCQFGGVLRLLSYLPLYKIKKKYVILNKSDQTNFRCTYPKPRRQWELTIYFVPVLLYTISASSSSAGWFCVLCPRVTLSTCLCGCLFVSFVFTDIVLYFLSSPIFSLCRCCTLLFLADIVRFFCLYRCCPLFVASFLFADFVARLPVFRGLFSGFGGMNKQQFQTHSEISTVTSFRRSSLIIPNVTLL